MFHTTRYVTPISLTVLPLDNETQLSAIHEQPILCVEFLCFFKIYSNRWTGTVLLNCIQFIQYTDSWHTGNKRSSIKLNKTPINIGHNTESLAVKCSNFNIYASWCLVCSFSEQQFCAAVQSTALSILICSIIIVIKKVSNALLSI